MQKSLANDSLRGKFRSGELCWASPVHLLWQFGGNIGVIQELLPTYQHMIPTYHHDTLLHALELICSQILCVSSECPQHAEASILSWPCYVGCLFASVEDFHWGKIIYVAKERTELTSPPNSGTTQLWLSEATRCLCFTFLHFFLTEQTSIAKQPSTSELGSVLSKLSTAGIASKALLTSTL